MRLTRLRSPLPVIAVSLLILGGLLGEVRQRGYLQFLELTAYDLLLASQPVAVDAAPAVVLLLIDERDIQRLGNWPLSDAQLHDILQRILAMRPRVLGVDIYRDLEVVEGHARLSALLRDDPRIIAIEKFPGAGSLGIPPPAVLQGSDRVGFSDLVTDPDGVVRRNLLFQSNQERTGYSLSLRLALAYLAAQGIHPAPDADDPAHLRLGDVTLVPLDDHPGGYVSADAGGYQVMLAYREQAIPFSRYRLHELLAGQVPAAALEDRIVILGVAAESVKDDFLSPFAILDQSSGILPGSVVHAHATQQLVDAALHQRRPLRWWDDAQELAYLWLWLLLGFLSGWFAGPAWRFAAVLLGGAAVIVAAAATAFTAGWWLPTVPPLFAWVLATTLSSALLAAHRRYDQQVLMSLFSRHVSPEVADAIWQRRGEVLDDGRVRPRTLTVTTLFTDLQGFTRVSEEMQPEPFLQWLNSYLAELTDIIMQHGGVLDDYAGDGIKASFGVPFCDPSETAQQARQALHCSLALGRALTRLNRQWQQQGRVGMAMRIGLHTGPVVVGTVGSQSRMKYTSVGRNVNLAARLENLKDVPGPDSNDECNNCRILLSEETAALVGDVFPLRDLGDFELKGIREKTRVFAIICAKTEETNHAHAQFSQPVDSGSDRHFHPARDHSGS